MSKGFSNEPMLDIFIYETTQNLEQLEESILDSEKANTITTEAINEIFRVMHTIKGSAAMMMYDNMASLAHSIEDLFFYIREEKPAELDAENIFDLVFAGADFVKLEMEKLKNEDEPDGDPAELIKDIDAYLVNLKGGGGGLAAAGGGSGVSFSEQVVLPPGFSDLPEGYNNYETIIYFDEDCTMENIRAFSIVHNLGDVALKHAHYPEKLIDDDNSVQIIKEQGFTIFLQSDMEYRDIYDYFVANPYVRDIELKEMEAAMEEAVSDVVETSIDDKAAVAKAPARSPGVETRTTQQSIISVDVSKLDDLMDLMGELVIAEAMVTQNPDVMALDLDNFQKAARQLQKITVELQDMAMSIRMVPLSTSFHKMRRIVRDMTKRLGKEADLILIGENTEVDKNIIEHITDPLMHLVRNAIDHGIEMPDDRAAVGKEKTGQVILEAKNVGGDVLILVKDDGKGLSREKVYQKALTQNLISPGTELTDREVYNLVLMPGFSTNEAVTEFSGRGVGMDVVTKNIEAVGGTISIDSVEGEGTITTLKIPLTLAIIDGMNIRVGDAKYTLPTISIKETFRAGENDALKDPDGNEIIVVRGDFYPVQRLHELFDVEPDSKELTEGIMLMIEQDEKFSCLFADELLGQQQVVVKALPEYIKQYKQLTGLAGCTLLGDGSISLILNIAGLLNM